MDQRTILLIFMSHFDLNKNYQMIGYSMGGGASGPKIMSDYYLHAPFESYTTYDFMENAGPDSSTYQSFFHICD